MELIDERSVLERAMMQFAHFKKEVERIDAKRYHFEMEYDKEDETDVLIQVLSFGNFVTVLAPEDLKRDLKRRIDTQLSMLEW